MVVGDWDGPRVSRPFGRRNWHATIVPGTLRLVVPGEPPTLYVQGDTSFGPKKPTDELGITPGDERARPAEINR